ncbi:MAG: tetratricopeptide repeat protein [Planctomycetales bacterium]|nr:tetratricopeptide repeat protein [Planctomycetales bacterium]
MQSRLLLLLWTVVLVGCGQSAATVATVSGEADYELGLVAYEKKDYAEASRHFDIALRTGGLNADLMGEALLKRARCSIEAGQFNEARRDLEDLDRSPAPPDEVLVTRAHLHFKEGDLAEANKLHAEAQKLNPKLPKPAWMK